MAKKPDKDEIFEGIDELLAQELEETDESQWRQWPPKGFLA